MEDHALFAYRQDGSAAGHSARTQTIRVNRRAPFYDDDAYSEGESNDLEGSDADDDDDDQADDVDEEPIDWPHRSERNVGRNIDLRRNALVQRLNVPSSSSRAAAVVHVLHGPRSSSGGRAGVLPRQHPRSQQSQVERIPGAVSQDQIELHRVFSANRSMTEPYEGMTRQDSRQDSLSASPQPRLMSARLLLPSAFNRETNSVQNQNDYGHQQRTHSRRREVRYPRVTSANGESDAASSAHNTEQERAQLISSELAASGALSNHANLERLFTSQAASFGDEEQTVDDEEQEQNSEGRLEEVNGQHSRSASFSEESNDIPNFPVNSMALHQHDGQDVDLLDNQLRIEESTMDANSFVHGNIASDSDTSREEATLTLAVANTLITPVTTNLGGGAEESCSSQELRDLMEAFSSENPEACPICYDVLLENVVVATGCGHCYHEACFRDMITKSAVRECCMCRAKLPKIPFVKLHLDLSRYSTSTSGNVTLMKRMLVLKKSVDVAQNEQVKAIAQVETLRTALKASQDARAKLEESRVTNTKSELRVRRDLKAAREGLKRRDEALSEVTGECDYLRESQRKLLVDLDNAMGRNKRLGQKLEEFEVLEQAKENIAKKCDELSRLVKRQESEINQLRVRLDSQKRKFEEPVAISSSQVSNKRVMVSADEANIASLAAEHTSAGSAYKGDFSIMPVRQSSVAMPPFVRSKSIPSSKHKEQTKGISTKLTNYFHIG